MQLPSYEINPPAHLSQAILDYWRETRRNLYEVTAINGDLSRSSIQSDAYRVDTVVFTRVRFRNLLLTRHKHHLDGELSDFVLLKVPFEKQHRKHSACEQSSIRPDTISIADFARPFELAMQETDALGIYLPHAAINYRSDHLPTDIDISLTSTPGRILQSACNATFRELHDLHPDDAKEIASGFTGLVQGLLSGAALSNSETVVQRARAHSMRNFLESRLEDADLDLAALQQAFGASRATIFRDFGEYGGVYNYIRTRRLERAYIDLAEKESERGAVTRAAERWGFSSVGQFCRAFRERFGVAPGSVAGVRADRASEETQNDRRMDQAPNGLRGDPRDLELWLSYLCSR